MSHDATSHTVHWDRLGLRIRLALRPDEPRVISEYLRCGEQLIALHGRAPWQVHDRMLSVLLGTAYDALLPIAWRITCLDTCTRPLSALGALVHDDVSARRFRAQARRLASFSYNPVNSDPTA